jgi:hypothetical protein
MVKAGRKTRPRPPYGHDRLKVELIASMKVIQTASDAQTARFRVHDKFLRSNHG